MRKDIHEGIPSPFGRGLGEGLLATQISFELTSARYRTESGSDRNKKAFLDNTAGFHA